MNKKRHDGQRVDDGQQGDQGFEIHGVLSSDRQFFPPGRPKEKSAPSGGSELHEVKSVGADFPPGRPKEKSAPSGGSELHEVKSVGAIQRPPATSSKVPVV